MSDATVESGEAAPTWQALARSLDRRGGAATWLAALRERLADGERHHEVKAMLEEPALIAAFADDELAAELGLRAAAAVGWHGGAGERLFAHIGVHPEGSPLRHLSRVTRRDLDLSHLVRSLPPSNPLHLPAPVRAWLHGAVIADEPGADALRRALHDDLARDPEAYLAWAVRLERTHYLFVEVLTARLAEAVAPERTDVAALELEEQVDVSERLRAMPAPRTWLLPVVGVAFVATMAITFLVSEDLAGGVFLGAIAAAVGTYHHDRGAYERWLRLPLLRLQLACGITQGAVYGWLPQMDDVPLRLRACQMFLTGDRVLQLLSHLAAIAHPGSGVRA